jgi:hypothetical protein
MCQLSMFICEAILVVSSSQLRQFKGELLQQMIHKMENYSGSTPLPPVLAKHSDAFVPVFIMQGVSKLIGRKVLKFPGLVH